MKRKLIIIILATLCALSAWATETITYQVDGSFNLKYEINTDGENTLTCNGIASGETRDGRNLVIPDGFTIGEKNYIVTQVGCSAFSYGGDLTGSITIGNNVKSIGSHAFAYNGFTGTITIPSSVELIEYRAFYACSDLNSNIVMLGDTPPTIQEEAFADINENLSITVSFGYSAEYDKADSDDKNTQDGYFNGMLINFQITYDYDGGEPCTDEEIASYTVNDNQSHSFYSTPKSVTLDNGCIERYNLSSWYEGEELFVEERVYIEFGPLKRDLALTAHYNASGIDVPQALPGTGYVKYDVQEGDSTLYISQQYPNPTGNVVIPETLSINNKEYTVVSINDYAFYDHSGITSISVPNSVTSIGAGAFCDCDELVSLTLSESINVIEYGTFKGCRKLQSIVIPEGVTAIRENAFQSCAGLKNFEIPSSLIEFSVPLIPYSAEIETMTINKIVPPALIFDAIAENAKVYVPYGARANYIAYNDYHTDDELWNGMIIEESFYMLEYDGNAENAGDRSQIDGAMPAFKTTEANQTVVLSPNSFTYYSFDYDGKVFLGWNTNPKATTAQYADGADLTLAQSIKLYAIWGYDIPTSVADNQIEVPFKQIQNTLYFNESTKIAIYTMSGKMLYKGKALEYTLPNAGVYIVCTNSESYKLIAQ